MDEQPIPYPPGLERINPHSLEVRGSLTAQQTNRVPENKRWTERKKIPGKIRWGCHSPDA
eukprot:scaffold566822_cov27-Prasinocladus_malaysianus.AAC.1